MFPLLKDDKELLYSQHKFKFRRNYDQSNPLTSWSANKILSKIKNQIHRESLNKIDPI